MPEYDAVVIGAGPAGSMAAYEIAAAGKSVLLIEKHKQAGTPLCCAEAVSRPSLEKLIKPLPEWICAEIEAVKVFSPSGEMALIRHPNAGYVLDRKIFDKALVERVVKAGGKLEYETIGVKLEADKDHFKSLEIIKPNGYSDHVEAKIFIAADGIESKIARLAGIDNLIDDSDIESLLQYRVENIKIDPEFLEFYVGNDLAPRGYIWMFPKSDYSANVGVGVAVALKKGNTAPEYLDRFLKARFGSSYEITEIHCGLVPRYQGKKKFCLKNLLVVGDAARIIDSLTGAGIINAMVSGKYARPNRE
jgi:digeranylgeranylglycerophospholipid reductase